MAMSNGDPALRTVVTKTKWFAWRRCTSSPVARLRTMPMMTLGRKRRAAWMAERCWTSWKLGHVSGSCMIVGKTYKRLSMVSVPLSTAHDRRTMTQMDAKAVFFHSELGIKADFPVLSRQLIQPRNAGIMALAAQSKAIFCAWWMLAGLSVMTLERS